VAVIRQGDAGRVASRATALDLGDLAAQAERVRALAREQAEATLRAAHVERERLLSSAREEGRRSGHAEGLAKGLEEGRAQGRKEAQQAHAAVLGSLQQAWAEALEGFALERDAILAEARQDVLRLAVLLAEKVTKRAIEIDHEVAAAQLESVLALVARPTRLIVRVHAMDEPIVREALPGLMAKFPAAQHVELRSDDQIERGSCVARTEGGGWLDASVKTQLDRLAVALLPDRRSPDQPMGGGAEVSRP
jgi:flagellar assembly protein FliH